MVKIGLIGLKDDREALLTVLHDLNVAQIEPIGKEAMEHLEPERGSELQRSVAATLGGISPDVSDRRRK
jgi:vacuolar-type H+-ATPase subunit I/STV1